MESSEKVFHPDFEGSRAGKDLQEAITLNRAQTVVDVLKQRDGEAIDVIGLFADNCSIVIRQVLFGGAKMSGDDFAALNVAYMKMSYLLHGRDILLAGPLAEYFFIPYTKGFKEAMEGKAVMERIFHKLIQEHEDTFDKDNLRNVVDYYIQERKTLRRNGDPKANFFTDSALVYSLIQFFGDGGFSVSWLISEIFKILAKHPEVQRRIQSEIDEVVGHDRLPTWADRNRLTYTSATLHEVQRTTDFFPILPSLECTKETTIQGHRIPKGAVTVVNMWAVHHDPELYEEPHKFDPSRYMSTEEKKPKAELPILFGVGKRSCAGESLTAMQLLLFTAAVLQNFDLRPVPDESGIQERFEVLLRVTPRIL